MPNPSKLDALLRGIAGQAPESKYIRAYHGSPYDFDRFDASKIGTGEGAQSYGYGHYLAESEKVASGYRDRLAKGHSADEVRVGDTPLGQILGDHAARGTPEKDAAFDLYWVVRDDGMSADEALTRAENRARAFTDPGEEDILARKLAWFQEARRRGLVVPAERPGRTYEVEIAYPADSLLDWDVPMGQQAKPVRENGMLLELAADEARNNALQSRSQGRHDHWMGIANNPADAPASLAMQAGKLRRLVGASGTRINPADLAQQLLNSGIPGVRYLDGNSRSAGQGTRNYVMFPGTEDSIRILRKYGVMAPVPVAAGAAGATMEE